MTLSYSTRLGVPIWSDDNDTFTRLELDQGFTSIEAKAATTGEGPVGGRPAFGPGGAFYLATDQGVLYYDTGSAWVVAGRVVIGTQVVQPAALQAASLTEWRNVSGSVLAKVNVDGSLAVDKVRFATAALNSLHLVVPINGVTNWDSAVYSALGYRMTVDGWCEIQGSLRTNGFAGGSISSAGAFPLPADGTLHSWPAMTGVLGSTIVPTYAAIAADGTLSSSFLTTGTGGFLDLDGIRYYVGG